MKTFILFYNPVAGKAYFKRKLDDFIAAMQQYNCLIIPLRTRQKEDACLLAQLAGKMPIEGVLIAGGDGTVHEVVNLMYSVGIDLPIGILPVGTSNDLAGFLGLSNDLHTCAKTFHCGKTRRIDIGLVNNHRYFLNVASVGLLANVAHTVNAAWKNKLGKMAYYLNGFEKLRKMRPIAMKITTDNLIIEDEIFLFIAANSGTVGGFSSVAPLAAIDDGKLDLIIVRQCPPLELLRIFSMLRTNRHVNNKYVTYLQTGKITLQSTERLESDLDGELGPFLPINIETVYRRVSLYDTNLY